jgi:ketosteroid isomerase-like protein
MRTVAIATLVFLGACSSESVGPPPAAPIDWHAFDVHRVLGAGPSGPTARERAVSEVYGAALASPGFSQLGPSLDSGAHFAFPGLSDARGREAVVHAHETLFGAFDARAIAVSRVWRTDSTQALEWTFGGTQARDWMGVAATGRTVAFKGLTLLWTKDDGSISDVHVYFDVATVKAQLGAGPKELAGLPAPAAPSAEAAPQALEQSGSPAEADNVGLARAWLDALEKNDLAGYEAAVTDDVEVVTPEREQPLRGKGDVRAYFKSIHKAIAQLDTTTDNAWGIGNFAIIEYDVAGEQMAAIGWVPAHHDKVVRLHVVDVLEVRDHKIARVARYDNPEEIAAAQ